MTSHQNPDHTPDPLSRFRGMVLRRGSWVGIAITAILVVIAAQEEVLQDRDTYVPVIVLGVAMFAGSVTRWDRILERRGGDWLAWGWVVVVAGSLASIGTNSAMTQAVTPLFFGVVVLSGAALDRVKHAITSVLVIAFYGFGQLADESISMEELVVPVVSLLLVAALVAILAIGIERETIRGSRALLDLRRQEVNYERLYAVTQTMANAESLADSVPNLVGTIGSFLGAEVGFVLVHRPEENLLRVSSPIWVSGNTLDVDQINVALGDPGAIQQAFKSGRALRLRSLPSDAPGILGELGLREAIVAPLLVEGARVGVIAVGDSVRGGFTQEDIEILAALAAPAALVVSQLDRYESAAQMSQRMEEMAQMKTDFVSIVSHELRSPLTSIIGTLDTISRPELAPENDAAKSLVTSARRQAGRLQRLIEDLLVISRIDRRALPIQPAEVDLPALLEEVVAETGTGEVASIDVDPDDLKVYTDPDHIHRIAINLVDNAAKYSQGSEISLVARREASGSTELAIIDHGPGIPDSEKTNVFERFVQLEPAQIRSKGGTGLGLSIVKALTEAVGGTIDLVDTPDGGATFIVKLPPEPASRRSSVL